MSSRDVRFVMLLGGPNHGEVYEVDVSRPELFTPAEFKPARWANDGTNRLERVELRREVYRREEIACPDGWRQPVYVHSSIPRSDLEYGAVSVQDVALLAVMAPWREQHRRAAARRLVGKAAR